MVCVNGLCANGVICLSASSALSRKMYYTLFVLELLEITLYYTSASSALSALGHKVRARIPAISSILPLDF
ncbi:MAG: hypothetical protein EZS28_038498 [Streblomastix strix]|uniref:Uncharacterized protein n=1 Tax=Streblomastix strix TaxID=222440 RepID=A0A5J4U8F8_9EUKA|nr:MAG: hypothetical protein EZS28_038498 [Streblomastix strix]